MTMARMRWLFLAAILLAGVDIVLDPVSVRQQLLAVLTAWWNRSVPILFPSLMAVQVINRLFPEWTDYTPMLMSLASFPWVGGLYSLVEWRRRRVPTAVMIRWLMWSNVYNPLLFAHPGQGLVLDVTLLLSAGIWGGLRPPSTSPEPPTLRGYSRIPLQAMNWITVYGGALLLGRLLAPPRLWPMVALLIDPVGIAPRARSSPILSVAALGLGGLAFLIPSTIAVQDSKLATKLLTARLFQAASAAAIFAVLESLTMQLGPVLLHRF